MKRTQHRSNHFCEQWQEVAWHGRKYVNDVPCQMEGRLDAADQLIFKSGRRRYLFNMMHKSHLVLQHRHTYQSRHESTVVTRQYIFLVHQTYYCVDTFRGNDNRKHSTAYPKRSQVLVLAKAAAGDNSRARIAAPRNSQHKAIKYACLLATILGSKLVMIGM